MTMMNGENYEIFWRKGDIAVKVDSKQNSYEAVVFQTDKDGHEILEKLSYLAEI